MLNIPYFQHRMTVFAEESLKSWLQTEVSIGRIDIGLLNRIIIDRLKVEDQAGKTLAEVPRFSASFDILPLLRGQISIRTVQLYGLKLHLYKSSPADSLNAAFLLEKFQKKKKKKEPSAIDLRINSVLMRRGTISYDVLNAPPAAENTFTPAHLAFRNVSATVSLTHLTRDSLHLNIKRMGFSEKSGLTLSRLRLDLKANRRQADIEELLIRTPRSLLAFSPVHIRYDSAPEGADSAGTTIHYAFSLLPESRISPNDFAALVPALRASSLQPHIAFRAEGSTKELKVGNLQLWMPGSQRNLHDLALQGAASLRLNEASQIETAAGTLSRLQVSPSGLSLLGEELAALGIKVPDPVANLESLDATAQWEMDRSGSRLSLQAATGAGKLELNAEARSRTATEGKGASRNLAVSAELEGREIDLGQLFPGKELGKTDFALQGAALLGSGKLQHMEAEGEIESFEYKNYPYKKASIRASYSPRKEANCRIRLDDMNASLKADASMTAPLKEKPAYRMRIEVDHLNPYHLHLAGDKQRDMEISLVAKADCAGSNADDLTGYLHLDSILVRKQGKLYPISYLHLEAQQGKSRRMVFLTSPFFEADIQGNMKLEAIPASVLRMMRPYVPSLFRWENTEEQKPDNNFNFFAHVRDTKMLTELLDLPLTIYENSYLSGFIEDSTGTLEIKGNFPSFRYGNNTFRNMALHCAGNPTHIDCNVNSNMFMKNGTLINLNLGAQARDDRVSGSFAWENHDEVEYKGRLELSALLKKRLGSNRLAADVVLHPTEVVIRDTAWTISEASIRIDSVLQIDRFALQHGRQSIRAAGVISASADDLLLLDLRNVQLGYVFDAVNFHSVDFDGQATGRARLASLLSQPKIDAEVHVRNFLFNGAPMGDLDIKSGFHAAEDVVPIDALIKSKEKLVTSVRGEVRPKRKGLDLRIGAQGCEIGFIQPYVEGILSRFQGKATGDFHLSGGFKSLQLEGKGLADAGFRVDVLGTDFHVKDTVYVSPTQFALRNALIADGEGHQGRVTARMNHTHFKQFSYNLQLDAENMLLVDKPESFDLPFFGKAYVSGTAYLSGNSSRLDLNGALTTAGDTEFCYKLTGNTVAEDNSFIQFAPIKFGQNPGDALQNAPATGPHPQPSAAGHTAPPADTSGQYTLSSAAKETPLDVRLNLLLDINPAAQLKVVVDPRAGDYISCTGNGNIRIDFFNKGDFNMFGTYTIDRGVYKFSLQEVIRKDFSIRQGSSLTFGGDPYRANCNLQAIYTVNAVSLRDLGSDVVNVLQTNQTSVRVNCVMDVTGILSSPEIHLGIELPNENEEVQSVVRNFISTDDQMNMQILYLLGIGKFYTPDYADKSGSTNSDAMSSVLSSTLSGQLNNMLSQVINSNKWNFGVNGSTGEEGWTDMEFQGMLSGQLLNNRLLVNGNFGYRDNSMNTNQQSNFIGDFDIEYLLTKSGDIRLRAYNKSNDRYSTKTTLNTQGIGVVIKRDFDSWLQLLDWRKEKKKEK